MQVSAHRRIERRELSGVFRVGNSFAEHWRFPKEDRGIGMRGGQHPCCARDCARRCRRALPL